jgi:hypothetical protein
MKLLSLVLLFCAFDISVQKICNHKITSKPKETSRKPILTQSLDIQWNAFKVEFEKIIESWYYTGIFKTRDKITKITLPLLTRHRGN